MYIVQAFTKTSTAERKFRSKEKAVQVAADTANIGYILLSNPELTKEQRLLEIESVRIIDTNHPGYDIDF